MTQRNTRNPIVRSTRFTWSVTLISACALLAGAVRATAQTVTPNKCAAAKVKCAAKKVKGLLNCHIKAESKGLAVDPACPQKAEDSFVACIAKAEKKTPCLTVGDVAALEARIDGFVLDAVEQLDPGYPTPVLNKCSAAKKKLVAKRALARLLCLGKAYARSGSVDPLCLSAFDAKFDAAFANLDAHPGCLTGGDALALAAAVDGFLADFGPVLADSPCDEEAQLDEMGGVILPPEATEIEGPTLVDEENPLPVSDLYPGLDTTTDEFYGDLPCDSSIGGTIPPDVNDPLSPDEQAAIDYVNDFEASVTLDQILQNLQINPPPAVGTVDGFTEQPCTVAGKQQPCSSKRFLHPDQPFEGRDIIYVHGLALDHLRNWLGNYTPAHREWPGDASEFLGASGYFRQYAEEYWHDHIQENLFDPSLPSNPNAGWQYWSTDTTPKYKPKNNRYLTIAYSCNQTLEYAQHAFLTQVREAIVNGLNVVTPPTYPAGQVMPFCANGCVVITHSTGALVAKTALGRAQAGTYGVGGQQVADKIKAHVSFEGAISGSRLASIGMAVGIGVAPAGAAANVICQIVDEIFQTSGTCGLNTSFVAQSILRDLMPLIAQQIWGTATETSPVPTVAFAGGHPTGNYLLGLTKLFLPGIDDGVVSMNSACGNDNPVFPPSPGLAPSGFTVPLLQTVRAFDMGDIFPQRAIKNFISQKDLGGGTIPGANYFAGACTPYLSTTGMLMPVGNAYPGTLWDARKRYTNIYSYLQGTIDHSYDGGSDDDNPWPSTQGASAFAPRRYLDGPLGAWNTEESSAVTDSAVFTRTLDVNNTRLAKPIPVREGVRGLKITFKLPFKLNDQCIKVGFLKWRCELWIWKRKYHRLDKWQTKQSSHYAYEFVARR